MRKSRIVPFLAFGLAALPGAPARAQAPDIAHDAVSCIVAGKYPKLKACFSPAAQVAKAQVYFRREDRPVWYRVEMASEEACFVGILPRPGRELIGKKVPYYVEVASQKLDVGRTQEHGPEVVRSEGDCKLQAVAPYVSQASVKVFPEMPPGFSAGGLSRGLVGGAAAAAIGIGVGVLAGGGNNPANTPAPGPGTVTPSPSPTPIPPSGPPSPPPTSNAPPAGVFAVSPDPPIGTAPMAVRFNLCRSSDPDDDPLVFRYDFGDGQRARGACREEHVYEAPPSGEARYRAEVCVGDGRPDHEQCRTFDVQVKGADQPPPAPVSFALAVAVGGTGAGTVTSDSGGISCPGTCTATYPGGTAVTLQAAPAAGSTFAGWNGAGCGAAPACTVTMTSAQSVTATFNAVPLSFPLTVALAGAGTGTVSSDTGGIACPGACSATYPSGTPVLLRAAATGGSSFVGWSVAACGTAATCTVTVTAPQTVTATFDPPTILRRITIQRTGNGLVESDVQPGIVCGAACSFPSFPDGATVVLTQTADPSWFFGGWGGDACVDSTARTCVVQMTQDYVIDAPFFPATAPEPRSSALSWISDLSVPRGRGQVLVNQRAWAVGAGQQRTAMEAEPGAGRVEATLTQGAGAGLWRFELAGGAFEPGTLRAVEGKVEALMADAVVFRLSGKAGERVAFVYRLAKP